jgi:hypothetical protein
VKPRFIFILFVLGILGAVIVCTRQPRYHGRTLTSWLRQYGCTSLDEPQRRQEAQSAVRAIGTKKALPKLLNLVEAKDDPVSLWLIDKTDRFRIRLLKWSSWEDYERIRWHSAEDFQPPENWGNFLIKKITPSPPSDVWCSSANQPNMLFAGRSPIKTSASDNGA